MREKFSTRRRVALGLALAGVAAIAVAAAACGGSKSTASSAPTTGATPAANTTPDRGFGNRTPSAAIQTSIAEGTPRPNFRGGTPPAGIQTAIAEGTRPAGFGGGGRVLGAVATLLNIDPQQLRTELQVDGVTIASVARAHNVDRATLRQGLITAEQQRLANQVSSGQMAQADADAQQSQFEANLDQLMDSNGGGGFGGPGGGAPGGPPPGAPQ